MDLDTLQNQINDLQRQLNELKSVASISRDVEGAMRERLNVPIIRPTTAIPVGSLQRSISLSGSAETIQVLDYPDEWISVTTINRQVKKIPVYIQ